MLNEFEEPDNQRVQHNSNGRVVWDVREVEI
jgi:hypothetical protein